MDLSTSGPTVGLLLAVSLTPKVILPFRKLGFALSLKKKKRHPGKVVKSMWNQAGTLVQIQMWLSD